MESLKELREYMDKTNNTILILGSKASLNLLGNMEEDKKKALHEHYNNKSFRRDNKKFWEAFNGAFSDSPLQLHPNLQLCSDLLKEGLVKKIYYQDIDGMIDGDNIVHIKGSIRHFVCSKASCQESYNEVEFKKLENHKCSKCGGKVRPTFLFIGDSYPDEVEEGLVNDLNETNVVITVGLDLEEDYIVNLIAAFDEKRYHDIEAVKEKEKEEKPITEEDRLTLDKTIVAIHDEDPEEVNYNEYFQCNFQGRGELNDSLSRFIEGLN